MITYNTYFISSTQFKDFLQKHAIVDNAQLLIQIFTAETKKSDIIAIRDQIHRMLPTAKILGATTDGEICSGTVSTGKTVVSISQFEHTSLKSALIQESTKSFEVGQKIASKIISEQTKVLITFTDGLHCNGELYLRGISSINSDITIAGGMAGDNACFKNTYVFSENEISDHGVVGVTLNSDRLHASTDYHFNWQPIGKNMTITKAKQNRVYEIDNLPILEVYTHYLGEDIAKKLPEIGVEFPLIIQKESMLVARAVLVKHDDNSLSFAGNFEVGDIVTFGHGNPELILNASADTCCHEALQPTESIFIYSCMARRRFMPEMMMREILPFQKQCDVAGFFTYGEFFTFSQSKELLNQTMTILHLSEAENAIKQSYVLDMEKEFEPNTYQKSIKALSHLLHTTTKEMVAKNKLLEEKTTLLQAKKESLDRAQEIAHFGNWEVDLTNGRLTWSRENFRIYRIDPSKIEPTMDTFISLVVPEDRHKIIKILNELEHGDIKTIAMKVRRTDGVIIHVLISGKIIVDDKGAPLTLLGTTLDITEQVELRAYSNELASIIENSTNEIYIIEKNTYRYLYVNRAALDKLGYSREEMYQMNVGDINKELTAENIKHLEAKVIKEKTISNRTTHTKKNGETYPVQSYIQYSTYQNSDVAIIFDIDISDLIHAEQKQKKQAQILEQIHDSVISTDLNDIITHWNHGASILHGYTAEEIIGHSIHKLYLDKDKQKIQRIKEQTLTYGAFQDEIREVTKSGKTIHTHVSLSVLKDEKDQVIGISRYSQDITQRKMIEDQLREQTELLNFQAYHDALTQLPNRVLFEDRLEQAIGSAAKHNEHLGLLFIDLDNFKQINDTLGHQYGDEVLKIVAKRFSSCIRKEDTLARLGGDEFTILIQDIQISASVAKIAQKIIESLTAKIVLEHHELHISASIGISLYPKDSKNKNDLLKYADTAMYKAKDEGRNNYQFYSEEMTLLAFEKAMIENTLRKAIHNQEFVVHYQPQIDSRDNSILGLEALVRWNHPEMGLIMPDTFIQIAEESDLIGELDSYVMQQAMSDVQRWHQEGLRPGVLSLNLSIKQLTSNDFIQKLKETIKNTHFDIHQLGLEITENQMMHNPTKSIERLSILKSMGIQIAIDDFGTGYSSLTYLKHLPAEILKLDRSFIKDLPHNDEDKAISKAIIVLAQNLNLTMIAEGVETQEQIEYLSANGCHYIQGFYYSKALNQEAMTKYLKKQ